MENKIYLTEVVLLTKSYNLQDFKDWLHWHLDIIGFNHVHIFDNESSVDIKTVCDSYGDRVSYEKVVGWPNQYALYNRYINNESKAWWVLTIDDDEFLYVSEKYNHNINDAMIEISEKRKSWNKLCIGWRNLFPKKYIEERTNKHLILNSTGYSHEACKHWQYGDLAIKCFVKTICKYDWNITRGHNPYNGGDSYTLNEEKITTNLQTKPTTGNEDLILFHYQFKSNNEWLWKCKNRSSPTNKKFKKDFPDYYKRIYNNKINEDLRMSKLWSK